MHANQRIFRPVARYVLGDRLVESRTVQPRQVPCVGSMPPPSDLVRS
jgi:hypothetical protein